MIITRKSLLSNKIHSMDLNITREQLNNYESGKLLLQKAFPNLNDAQREFIKTGITDKEWNNYLPQDSVGFYGQGEK